MAILGATTNAAMGFLFPIIYYLKLEKKAPRFATHKMVAYIVFGIMCICSVVELGTFFYT